MSPLRLYLPLTRTRPVSSPHAKVAGIGFHRSSAFGQIRAVALLKRSVLPACMCGTLVHWQLQRCASALQDSLQRCRCNFARALRERRDAVIQSLRAGMPLDPKAPSVQEINDRAAQATAAVSSTASAVAGAAVAAVAEATAPPPPPRERWSSACVARAPSSRGSRPTPASRRALPRPRSAATALRAIRRPRRMRVRSCATWPLAGSVTTG